jgi:aryl-alcohol dehydrogenase-like predicted oxidoreductase
MSSGMTFSVLFSQNETSEKLLGEWMKERGNRDQMVIATKVWTILLRLLSC